MKNSKIYLGLDIGTDSVGYAVTNDQYDILKFHGEAAWGSTVFDSASLSAERRGFRSARRRLDRRQQRVALVQELFSSEVNSVDPAFFKRIKESSLFRDEVNYQHTLFNDDDYTDVEYYDQYPTIHHLISDLMNNKESHDVRLVYLAIAWLVAHRGHFLSNIDINNIDKVKDFGEVYAKFINFFEFGFYDKPWGEIDTDEFGAILKSKNSITIKNKLLTELLFGGEKPSKEATDGFPFNREAMVKLLAGGTCKLKDLFNEEAYEEFGSVSLNMDDDKLGEIADNIGDDFELIESMRLLTDWAMLVDILGDGNSISEAKVEIYNQHEKDLTELKRFIKKYIPEKYDEVFRALDKPNNYVAYSYHVEGMSNTKPKKKANQEDFCKYILGLIKTIDIDEDDAEAFEIISNRLQLAIFMPKQKTTSNRVIPYQLYAYELKKILHNAEQYLEFLNQKDEDGLSISDKVYSIFTYRIPYFVGPLNKKSEHSWIRRKAGKIYPWNFKEMVDLDESEQAFIERMTNKCTYLPDQPVLPKDSLLYHKFMVLNEINNIRINQEKISVELKQDIYNDLFMNIKKVTRKRLTDYLISRNVIKKGEEDIVTGIDITINSNLSSQIAFKKLINSGALSEVDVERIIERASYAEDKSRLLKWISKNYPHLTDEDKKYISRVKIKDFGRLSRKFLSEFIGANNETGELVTVIGELWNTNNNMMELLSDKYTFVKKLDEYRQDYYQDNKMSLNNRLDEMYISNSVKRSIYRTMAIVKDVEKAFGKPDRIFIEVARGASEDQKNKRTQSRKQQILDLYSKCKDEDVRILKQQLEEMGEYAENRLQGDKLFLYYMQQGRCAYSGKSIELEKLGTKAYDIDHIYPQAYVKDDSILNNKVLVLSELNGEKSDTYPIKAEIRDKMSGFWNLLKERGFITEEKYKRLTRSTPFTSEEKLGFINRQLTETSQSTKAVATILKEKYPECEIVYCKARLTSEFRKEFNLPKSRLLNDLHHAVDAYLNIVTGNVYNMKFTKRWFDVNSKYSINTVPMFTKPLIRDGITVWDGEKMLAKVIKTAQKQNAHFTKFAYMKHGGFFDQMPVDASDGLVPLKKGLDTEKYGGYNKAGVMFFIPVRYKLKKKNEVIIMSVEMLYGKRFLEDKEFAKEYAFKRLNHILGKQVDDVEFPMGFRPWKVNTMLSLDGYRVCIAGIGGGGKCLIAQPCTQFMTSPYWNYYVKKLENFVEKTTKNANYIYDETFDVINYDKNIELYDLFIDKYKNSIMKNRVNAPIGTLEKGSDSFNSLDIKEQARVLLNILLSFNRSSSSGVDLTSINGAGRTGATVNFSSSISNWKKAYSSVRIIDNSVTGLWSKISDINLLELV